MTMDEDMLNKGWLREAYEAAIEKRHDQVPLTLKDKTVLKLFDAQIKVKSAVETAGYNAGNVVLFSLAVAFRIISPIAEPFINFQDKRRYAQPLEEFEPKEVQQAPYWQDIIFGEGRVEKLVERLKALNLPPVSENAQKDMLFFSEGGLHVLSAHRELVKYGLTDSRLIRVARDIAQSIAHLKYYKSCPESNDEDGRFLNQGQIPQAILLDANQGVLSLSPEQYVIASREKLAARMAESLAYADRDDTHHNLWKNDHPCLGEMTFGGPDPVYRDNAEKLCGALYDWIVLDVAPVVPRILRDYVAQPEAAGQLALTEYWKRWLRLDQKFVKTPGMETTSEEELCFLDRNAYEPGEFEALNREEAKPLYDVYIEGYKGALLTPSAAQPGSRKPGRAPSP